VFTPRKPPIQQMTQGASPHRGAGLPSKVQPHPLNLKDQEQHAAPLTDDQPVSKLVSAKADAWLRYLGRTQMESGGNSNEPARALTPAQYEARRVELGFAVYDPITNTFWSRNDASAD